MLRSEFDVGEFYPYVVGFHHKVGVLDMMPISGYTDAMKEKKYAEVLLVSTALQEKELAEEFPQIWQMVFSILENVPNEFFDEIDGVVLTASFESHAKENNLSWLN